MRLPLILGKKSDRSASPYVSIERLVNGYLESAPQGKEPTPIFGSPGLTLWLDLGQGGIRALFPMGDKLYAVSGSTLVQVTEGRASTELGSIGANVGGEGNVVSIDGDGTSVVAVNDGEIYVWDGATLAAVTDPDAPDASCVAWVDGFFTFVEEGTEQFFISPLNAPAGDYDALDFASAEWKPDKLKANTVFKRTLFLMGEKTIEAQQNVGGAAFPFARDTGVNIDCGLIGRAAFTVTDDTIFWLAHDKTARRLDGLQATTISRPAVNTAFAAWPNPELTVVTSHVWNGHRMVTFRNPAGCWEYDQTTNLWHERESYGMPSWRGRCVASFAGEVLVGSVNSGKIYKLDSDAYTEAGDPLPFEIVTPYAYQGGAAFTIDELELVMETGVGTLTTEPTITCERTTDGMLWSLPIQRTLGKVGVRDRRISFGVQGQARAMAWRFRITDDCKRVILGAYAEGEVDA